MCVSVAMAGISAATSVAGAMSAGDAQRQQGDAAAYEGFMSQQLREMEAQDVMNQADEKVQQIRRQAQEFRGSQVVQQAANGVMIGSGSAQAMIEKTTQLAEADALATLYSGVNKASSIKLGGRMDAQAGMNRAAAYYEDANNRQTAAFIDAGTSLLSFGGKVHESGYFKTKD